MTKKELSAESLSILEGFYETLKSKLQETDYRLIKAVKPWHGIEVAIENLPSELTEFLTSSCPRLETVNITASTRKDARFITLASKNGSSDGIPSSVFTLQKESHD